MSLDYNDSVVGGEFAQVQTMSFEEIVEECERFGILILLALDDVNARWIHSEFSLLHELSLKSHQIVPYTKIYNTYEEKYSNLSKKGK